MPFAVPPVFALGHTIPFALSHTIPFALSHTIPFALSLSKPVLSRVEGGFVLRGDTEGFVLAGRHGGLHTAGRHGGLRLAQPEREVGARHASPLLDFSDLVTCNGRGPRMIRGP